MSVPAHIRNDGIGATSCKAITITDSDKNVTSYALASFIELQDLLGQNSLLRYIPNAQKSDDPNSRVEPLAMARC